MFNQFSVSMYGMCSAGQLQKFFKSLMLFKLQLYLGVVSLGYSPLLPGVPYRCTFIQVPRTPVYQMLQGCGMPILSLVEHRLTVPIVRLLLLLCVFTWYHLSVPNVYCYWMSIRTVTNCSLTYGTAHILPMSVCVLC